MYQCGPNKPGLLQCCNPQYNKHLMGNSTSFKPTTWHISSTNNNDEVMHSGIVMHASQYYFCKSHVHDFFPTTIHQFVKQKQYFDMPFAKSIWFLQLLQNLLQNFWGNLWKTLGKPSKTWGKNTRKTKQNLGKNTRKTKTNDPPIAGQPAAAAAAGSQGAMAPGPAGPWSFMDFFFLLFFRSFWLLYMYVL